VELRICMACGLIGCCNSSKNKHATRHFHETGHHIIKDFPGVDWTLCYIDEIYLPEDL
jgi:monovalent cation:H+ antiporter-2, CPA2 family